MHDVLQNLWPWRIYGDGQYVINVVIETKRSTANRWTDSKQNKEIIVWLRSIFMLEANTLPNIVTISPRLIYQEAATA